MDIGEVDLNLLVIFDALLRARSVSGAARKLGISQPAASLGLQRLRKIFGDPLFIRTARGIHPTPHAEILGPKLEAILDRIRTDVLQQPTFDPATVDRAVTLNMQDIGEAVFLPRILERLSKVAPGIQLRAVNLPVADIERALRSGEVDLVLGHFPELESTTLYQQRLFAHSFVCLVRADHPQIGAEMSRKQFLDSEHAVVSLPGRNSDSLETDLAAQDLTRRVSVRIEHFLAVPRLIGSSDLICTVPYAIGSILAKLGDLRLVRLPIRAKPRVVRQHWHPRFHHDAANRWLRRVVAELFVDRKPRLKSRGGRR